MAEMVTVACRLPMGVHLDLHDALGVKRRVTARGANASHLKVNGAGFTMVPKDHWDAWLAKNKDLSFVKAGLIWAARNDAEAEKERAVRASDKTGWEGVEPGDVDKRLKEIERA